MPRAESLLQSKVVNFLEADKDREKHGSSSKYAVQDFPLPISVLSYAAVRDKKVLAFDRHFKQKNFIVNEL